MKIIAFTCACVLLAVVVQCYPGDYAGAGDSNGYGGGASGHGGGSDGYGGNGGGGAGGYGGGGYSGPKSTAAEALKSLYNNQDGYNYNFGYNLEDSVYNNYQTRQESGSSDPKGMTKGSYSVVEPDGSKRTVDYVADWVNGFRATVRDKNGVTQYGYDNGGYGGDSGSHSGGSGNYGGAASDYSAGGHGDSGSKGGY